MTITALGSLTRVPLRPSLPSAAAPSAPMDSVQLAGGQMSPRTVRILAGGAGAAAGAVLLGVGTAGLSGSAAAVVGGFEGAVAFGAAGAVGLGLLGAVAGWHMGDNSDNRPLGQFAGLMFGGAVGAVGGTLAGAIAGAKLGGAAGNALGYAAGAVAGGLAGLVVAHHVNRAHA